MKNCGQSAYVDASEEAFELARIGDVEDLVLEVHDDGAAQAGEEIVRYRHHPIPHPGDGECRT